MPIGLNDITENDVLTWELTLAKEGTLPPRVQELLLRGLRDLLQADDDIESAYEAGVEDGQSAYEAGVEDGQSANIGYPKPYAWMRRA